MSVPAQVMEKRNRVALTGNEAVAHAMKQINPDVVAAYPITPQTEVVQIFSTFVADGTVDTEFITVESEHSAMSATIGASAAGARAMTATSSQGLMLMMEVVHIAASLRLPIVMPVVNRAISGPINIHCDHSDSMAALTSGWIQLYAEDVQEAYDNMIQAVRIAEHKDVKLPVMVCYDGFIISHALDTCQVMADEEVKKFIGEYKPESYLLNAENPITIGALDLQDYYFEHRRQQAQGMINAKRVIKEVAAEFEKVTGRKYGFFEEYKLEDAEVALVIMSSAAGTAKDVVDELRAKGVKAGLLKPRVFRPFPAEEIANALKGCKAVAVMDRAESFNAFGGPLFNEVRSAMFDHSANTKVISYIYGLGGRDVYTKDIASVYEHLQKIAKSGQVDTLLNYLGVRE